MILTDLTITQALEKLKSGEITSVGLTNAYLDKIEKYNDELFAYLTITRERALADAAESDARYANGTARALEGIPIALKDNFSTYGIRSTSGSKILENFVPHYESFVSQKLKDAGTVLLGKVNMSEFGMSSTPLTSAFGPSYNPYKRELKLTPGGSSCGSASAVAAGLAMVATGTDTGNSIRVPASICGLVGYKPTYGLCSRFGCSAFASSLDHPGTLARNVSDTAIFLGSMMGYDERDSTSAKCADEIANELLNGISAIPLGGIRIGIIREFENLEIDDEIKKLFNEKIEQLKEMGAQIIDISVPQVMDVETLYMVISRNEASSNLARYDGMRYGTRIEGNGIYDTFKKTRAAGFGKYVKFRMVTGSIMLTEKFVEDCFYRAARVRRVLDNQFLDAFKQCDFILSPAGPTTAKPLPTDFTEKQISDADTLLIGANMSGMPSVSVPMGMVDELPIGMQIMGNRFDDVRVLQMAKMIEEMIGFENKPSVIMGE